MSASMFLCSTIAGNILKPTVSNGNFSLMPAECISPFLSFVLNTDFASLRTVLFPVANHDNTTVMLFVTNTDPSETVG